MKSIVINVICTLVGVTLTISIDYLFKISPNLAVMQKDITTIDSTMAQIQKNITSIEQNYLKKDKNGSSCNIGFSADLKMNEISIFESNKFNLKRGDRVELCYPYGTVKISIECYVSYVQKTETNSNADFFMSKECLELFNIPKKERNKGLFSMTVKKIQE